MSQLARAISQLVHAMSQFRWCMYQCIVRFETSNSHLCVTYLNVCGNVSVEDVACFKYYGVCIKWSVVYHACVCIQMYACAYHHCGPGILHIARTNLLLFCAPNIMHIPLAYRRKLQRRSFRKTLERTCCGSLARRAVERFGGGLGTLQTHRTHIYIYV